MMTNPIEGSIRTGAALTSVLITIVLLAFGSGFWLSRLETSLSFHTNTPIHSKAAESLGDIEKSISELSATQKVLSSEVASIKSSLADLKQQVRQINQSPRRTPPQL